MQITDRYCSARSFQRSRGLHLRLLPRLVLHRKLSKQGYSYPHDLATAASASWFAMSMAPCILYSLSFNRLRYSPFPTRTKSNSNMTAKNRWQVDECLSGGWNQSVCNSQDVTGCDKFRGIFFLRTLRREPTNWRRSMADYRFKRTVWNT